MLRKVMKYRYVISKSSDPYVNLATEQALLSLIEEDMVILFLWQNDNTIVIGRNQDVYAECKVEEFLALGGRIARRHSGGGAVYHDLGNLNFSLISSVNTAEKFKYQEIVFQALLLFGISVEFNGRNDLTFDGKKFSGNAVYYTGDAVCQHGTLLVSADLKRMTYFLTPDAEKLKRNGVGSVASRVMNLSDEFPQITIEGLQNALIRATKAEELEALFKEEEIQKQALLYAKENWIFGRSFG